MTGFDYYKQAVGYNYANFSGRARRSEYWYFILFHFLITTGLFAFSLFSLYFSPTIAGLSTFVLYLYGIAMIVPQLAVGVRRLHDTNKSGWLFLIAFIPLVGLIILIVFFATEGTKGWNDYGYDPKEDLIAVEPEIEEQLI